MVATVAITVAEVEEGERDQGRGHDLGVSLRKVCEEEDVVTEWVEA